MDYKFGLPLKKDGAFANLIVIAVSVLSGMFEKKHIILKSQVRIFDDKNKFNLN